MASWFRVATVDEVKVGQPLGLERAHYDIVLYRVGDTVFATDNMCTHGAGRLCDGFLEGHVIECPIHQGRFDVRSGDCLGGPVTDELRTYPVRMVDGQIEVLLDEV